MKEKKIERKVADAILEERFPVTIKGKTFYITRLKYRNYIEISALAAESGVTTEEEQKVAEDIQNQELPVEERFNKKNVSVLMNFVFKEGVSANKQAELLAVMFLNARTPRSFIERTINKLKLKRIKRMLLDLTASEFSSVKLQLFNQLEYVDFFLNTVSLREINMLRETVTTVSGQPSEG